MTDYHDYMNTHKTYPDDISRRIDIAPGFNSVRPAVKESLTTAGGGRMNREDAAREIDNTACCFSDKRFRDAMHMAAALRGPQPDPVTGLVPCGCGQPLALKHNPGRCEVPYDDPSDPDNWTKRPTWWVECKKCGLAIGKWHDEDFSEERGWYDSAEEAVHAANRAMGVKETTHET